MKLTKEQTIQLFEAAGYEFKGEEPKGRLLITIRGTGYHYFYLNTKDNITHAMNFICEHIYSEGIKYGKEMLRTEIKQALGID